MSFALDLSTVDGKYREKFEVWEKLRNQLSMRGYKNFIARGHESREKKLNNCGELLKAAMEKQKYEEVIFLLQELETQLIEKNVKIKTHEKTDVTLLHHAAFAGWFLFCFPISILCWVLHVLHDNNYKLRLSAPS